MLYFVDDNHEGQKRKKRKNTKTAVSKDIIPERKTQKTKTDVSVSVSLPLQLQSVFKLDSNESNTLTLSSI